MRRSAGPPHFCADKCLIASDFGISQGCRAVRWFPSRRRAIIAKWTAEGFARGWELLCNIRVTARESNHPVPSIIFRQLLPAPSVGSKTRRGQWLPRRVASLCVTLHSRQAGLALRFYPPPETVSGKPGTRWSSTAPHFARGLGTIEDDSVLADKQKSTGETRSRPQWIGGERLLSMNGNSAPRVGF